MDDNQALSQVGDLSACGNLFCIVGTDCSLKKKLDLIKTYV